MTLKFIAEGAGKFLSKPKEVKKFLTNTLDTVGTGAAIGTVLVTSRVAHIMDSFNPVRSPGNVKEQGNIGAQNLYQEFRARVDARNAPAVLREEVIRVATPATATGGAFGDPFAKKPDLVEERAEVAAGADPVVTVTEVGKTDMPDVTDVLINSEVMRQVRMGRRRSNERDCDCSNPVTAVCKIMCKRL